MLHVMKFRTYNRTDRKLGRNYSYISFCLVDNFLERTKIKSNQIYFIFSKSKQVVNEINSRPMFLLNGLQHFHQMVGRPPDWDTLITGTKKKNVG